MVLAGWANHGVMIILYRKTAKREREIGEDRRGGTEKQREREGII